MTTATDLADRLKQALGEGVRVRARRPNIFQVELPAWLRDGDVAMMFVQPRENGLLRLTDLGHTRMRLSYRKTLTPAMDRTLDTLARAHGLELEAGEVSVLLPAPTLAAGALGLLQVQSEADATITAAVERGERSESFKRSVVEALTAAFSTVCELNYHDPASDPEGIYALDALIHGNVDVGVSIVPTDLDAERAVANKLHVLPSMKGRPRWVAIPRNIEQLAVKTKMRLMQEHLVPLPVWDEGKDKLKDALSDLAR